MLEVPVLVESFWENKPTAGSDLNLKLGRNIYLDICVPPIGYHGMACHSRVIQPPGEG